VCRIKNVVTVRKRYTHSPFDTIHSLDRLGYFRNLPKFRSIVRFNPIVNQSLTTFDGDAHPDGETRICFARQTAYTVLKYVHNLQILVTHIWDNVVLVHVLFESVYYRYECNSITYVHIF
jgi:hypothetical protein